MHFSMYVCVDKAIAYKYANMHVICKFAFLATLCGMGKAEFSGLIENCNSFCT